MSEDKNSQRKGFDYQERWHGFGSPVGLGAGWALFGLGVLLLSASAYLLAHLG